jgi:ABC-type oligopeptide transport system ATPase subunit
MNDYYKNIKVQNATYNQQELIDFQGNKLIEALPPILSSEDAFEKLSFYPLYNERERDLPEHLRYHALLRLIKFFQPVMQHLDLEKRFSRLIRYGYVGRNPQSPEFTKQLNIAHQALIGNDVSFDIRSTASSFTLMGYSGIGKTTAIERILSLYPQLIIHEHPLNLMQIVWLKLNCPHDGSLKSLCMDFFYKVDSILGTNYLARHGGSRNSISSMVTRMGQIARLHCIGAIIIDEIQHLLTAKSDGSEKMMNFFVTLINEVGVPVMMIGTMKARSILQRDFRQARRGSGQGDMVWEQMPKGDDWDMLIENMWRYQWTKQKVELTKELNDKLYEESQGIIDIAVKLFILSQSRAVETGKEIITPGMIRTVASDDLRLVQPMLRALKSGLVSEIEKYEDIMPMDIASYLQHRSSTIDLRATIQKQKERQAEARQRTETTMLEKTILALIDLDIDTGLAEKAATTVLKQNPKLTQVEAMQKALALIQERKKPKKKKESKAETNALQIIVEKGKKQKKSAYEALKEAGYIKNPLDEFAM